MQGIELANIDSFSLLAKASCFSVEQVCEHLVAIEESLTEISNEIPWKSIHGVRVRIAHIYDAIEMDVIYKIITEDFVSLRSKLVNIINKI
ncbi:MAG: DUF86 domain-containing protein [Bacilli bacterium]|nr:DUF86 domain-containing protein [Bacilli bacterium]